MEWPVNALFVLLGALLTWITPHGVKLRWARVVAVCLGLRVRLEPTPEARLHKRILYWSGRLIFGVASNLLYPRVFITSERDMYIRKARSQQEADIRYRSQPVIRRLGASFADPGSRGRRERVDESESTSSE